MRTTPAKGARVPVALLCRAGSRETEGVASGQATSSDLPPLHLHKNHGLHVEGVPFHHRHARLLKNRQQYTRWLLDDKLKRRLVAAHAIADNF